jgi:hypothetical protein
MDARNDPFQSFAAHLSRLGQCSHSGRCGVPGNGQAVQGEAWPPPRHCSLPADIWLNSANGLPEGGLGQLRGPGSNTVPGVPSYSPDYSVAELLQLLAHKSPVLAAALGVRSPPPAVWGASLDGLQLADVLAALSLTGPLQDHGGASSGSSAPCGGSASLQSPLDLAIQAASSTSSSAGSGNGLYKVDILANNRDPIGL